jgi:hypothetical protein
MQAKNVTSIGQQTAVAQPVEALYIVGIVMSSPNQTLRTRWTDNTMMTAEVDYRLTPEERKAISRVRASYGRVRDECVNFMGSGMLICKESQLSGPGDEVEYSEKDLVTGRVSETTGRQMPPTYPEEWGIEKKINVGANTCMKAIDPRLSAHVRILPLQSASTSEGQLYEQIVASIRHQIYGDLFKRLQEVIAMGKEKMLPKTKQSLIDKIENMRQANIMNDPEIDRELDRFLQVVNTEVILPLIQELDQNMDMLSSRFGMMRGGDE